MAKSRTDSIQVLGERISKIWKKTNLREPPPPSKIGKIRPFAMRFFFDSSLASQPIVDVLRPQSHGVGRVLLGMSSPTLRQIIDA